jgi:nucleoside-diphosphate-sugar epimerase
MAALARAVRARRAFIVGDGENRKSMVFAGNLADRLVLAAARPLRGTYVAADGDYTQREIITALAHALGRRPPPSLPRVPLLAAARALDRVAGTAWAGRIDKLATATEFDGRALDETLGYTPRTSFADGIGQTAAWIRDA